ncbi:outer membrane protein [Aliidiomarina haloalkalitolerans]|uniref:Outer membrane protein beta-barrel domain-containing protein n=1 Tax=Aliidiomarina haloalkalitolerans TaxID=859059 RepID=A0A432VQD3_9GAMM|nr:outer membrane beta-barrel protein [Aliidiomarina haloalkalitolerans]RUO18371.1 hypothetical protein CWE06_10970 [Aliidiomarina haloalkalitolerans]
MKILKSSALIGALLVSGNVLANDLTYDFANVSYVKYGTGSDSIDGFGFELNKLLNDKLYLNGSYTNVSDSFSENVGGEMLRGKVDGDLLSFGLGYRHSLQQNVDWFLEGGLSYVDMSARVSGGGVTFRESYDDTGYYGATGINALLTPKLQAQVFVRYTDIADTSSTEFGVQGRYRFTNNFHGIVGVSRDSDDTTMRIGLSYAF